MGVNIQKYSVKLVKETGGRYDLDSKVIKRPYDLYKIVIEVLDLDKIPQEQFVLITLDIKNQVTGIFIVSQGTLSSAQVSPQSVFQRAILQNAAAVLFAHNHPSGVPDPSGDDIKITKKLIESGNLLGIDVLDHIVIGDGCFKSLKEEGLI